MKDFKQVQDLFLAIVDLPSNQQADWLREHVSEDQELYDEVYSLLQFDTPSHDALEVDAPNLLTEAIQVSKVKHRDSKLSTTLSSVRSSRRSKLTVNMEALQRKDKEASTLEHDHLTSDYSLTEQQILGNIITQFELPNYELLLPIGAGAFGSVWKARDLRLERFVAIKISRLPHVRGDKFDRALREARLTARLSHPNIVTVHEIGEHLDHRYIVSDWIDGLPLHLWAEDRDITLQQAATITAKIAEALDHSHRHGVIHCDIKPANIMMDRNHQPILVDFGLARLFESDAAKGKHRVPVGTPAYMPPEQVESNDSKIDRRSDIYSLGVTLFELLTGERPFRGDTENLFQQLLDDSPPVSPNSLKSVIPKDLNTICLKCLQKTPSDRYSNAGQLADDLRCFLEYRPISARPIGRLGQFYRWTIRNPKVASLSAICLVLLSVLWITTLVSSKSLKLALQESTSALDKAQQAAFIMHIKQGDIAAKNGDPTLAALWFSNSSLYSERGSVGRRHSQLRVQTTLNSAPRLTGFFWHDGEQIDTLEVSPCGRYATTRTTTDACRVLDLKLKSVVLLHHRVRCVAWSPDQQHMALGLTDGNVLLFKTSNWNDPFPLYPGGAVTALQFSPDGQQLAIAGTSLHFWDLTAESFSHPSCELSHRAHALTYSQSGSQLAVSFANNTLQTYRLKDHALITVDRSIEHHSIIYDDYPPCLPVFVPDTDHLVTAKPKFVAVTRGTEFESVHCFQTPTVISGLGISSNGKQIAVCGPTHLQIWNADKGEPTLVDNGNRYHFSDVSFNPDGSMLAAAGRENIVRLYRLDGKSPESIDLHHSDWVRYACFLDQGTQLITAQRDGLVRLWNVESELNAVKRVDIHGRISRVKLSSDGSRFLVCGSARVGGTVDSAQVYETSTGLPIGQRLNKGHLLIDAAFTPDGKSVITVDVNKQLKIWDWRTGQLQRPAIELPREPRAIAFDPSGVKFIVAYTSGLLQFRDGRSPILKLLAERTHGSGRQLMLRKEQHVNAYQSPSNDTPVLAGEGIRSGEPLCFSRDGKLLITSSHNRSTMIWDLRHLDRKPRSLQSNRRTSRSLLSNNQAYLATIAANKASVWDLNTGELLCTLEHPAEVRSVQFSQDDQRLLTACGDGLVRNWDWRSGEPISPTLSHPARVNCAKFIRNDSLIITISKDEQLRVWDADSGFMVCPPLAIDSEGIELELTPNKRHLLVSAGGHKGSVSSVIDLNELLDGELLPVEEMRHLAELTSGRTIVNASESVLTTPQLLDRWGLNHVSMDRGAFLERGREFERQAKWDKAIEQYRTLTDALPRQDAYVWLKQFDTSCWREWDRNQSIDSTLELWEQGRDAIGYQEQELCLEVAAAAWCVISGNQDEYERLCRIMLDRPIDRQTPRTLFQMARILSLGDHTLIEPEQMVEIAEEAIARDSSLGYFRTALTHCLIRANQYDEALIYCDGHAALTALCYAHMGREKLARQWIKTAQDESDVGPLDPRSDWFPTRRLMWQIYLQEAESVLASD